MSKSFIFKISIFLSIIFGIFYWTYNHYLQDDEEIITIYPDPAPTKIKPEESRGIIIANTQNTIYENLQKKKIGKQIVLQPEPEKPLNINPTKSLRNDEIDPIENIILEIEEIDKAITHNLDIKAKVKEGAGQNTVPTVGIKEKIFAREMVTAEINQVNLPKAGLNIIKVAEKRKDFSEKQLLNKKKINYYKIQLASVKTEVVANQEMDRIKKKYAKLFNKIPLFVRKMRSEQGNLFYSVMAGNYEDITQAKAICKKLDNSQGCLITNR